MDGSAHFSQSRGNRPWWSGLGESPGLIRAYIVALDGGGGDEFICAVRAFAGLQGESEIETLFFQSYSLAS